jgi:hypothetical protein
MAAIWLRGRGLLALAARGVSSQLARIVTVTRPTIPAVSVPPSRLGACQCGLARSTATARPSSSVTTTRHSVSALRAASRRSCRDCRLVTGPIRLR